MECSTETFQVQGNFSMTHADGMEPHDEQSVLIACAADDRFAMPLAVTLCSAAQNLHPDRQMTAFILDGGISPGNRQRIRRSIPNSDRITLCWIEPAKVLPQFVERIPSIHRWPPSSYYRLLLPYLIPTDIGKVIYLDCDLVVTGDLAQLWDTDLAGYSTLAVQDPCSPLISSTKHLTNWHELGIAPEAKYFNSGVLVIDLERWRSEQVGERALQFMQNYGEYILFPDQDALNVVMAGNWGELTPQWNQMHVLYQSSNWQALPYREADLQQAIQTPYIIHFTTRPKPWEKQCVHAQKDLFFRYVDLTAWKGWRNTLWRRFFRKLNQAIAHLLQSIQTKAGKSKQGKSKLGKSR